MSNLLKLSSPETRESWSVPVLFEDEHLLALNKPNRLLTSPDGLDPERPNLLRLLHRDIQRGAPWTTVRNLGYLRHAHRLDFETSGVLLLAKSKPVLLVLANLFGAGKVIEIYAALVQGVPDRPVFSVEAGLRPHPTRPGLVGVDPKGGRLARTEFSVRERFAGYTLIECRPQTARFHQVRVHLRRASLPVVGDGSYGGRPLLLSRLKSHYRFKRDRAERPLIATAAVHAEEICLVHPVSGAELRVAAPWPKDLSVAVRYLRRHAAGSGPWPVPAAGDRVEGEPG